MNPSEADLGNFVKRLTRVEKENSFLKRLIAGVVIFVASSVACFLVGSFDVGLAQGNSGALRSIDASEYILRDSQGRVRASLSFLDARGSPNLTFFDSVGRARLSIWADDESTSVVAYSPNGGDFQTHMSASQSSATTWAQKIHKGATERAVRFLATDDAASLSVEDQNALRTIVGNTPLGPSSSGKSRWTSAASVVMYDENGNVLWQAPPSK